MEDCIYSTPSPPPSLSPDRTILWRTGLETDSVLSGRLEVLRIRIGERGNLIIDFKTTTKFRGQISCPRSPFEPMSDLPLPNRSGSGQAISPGWGTEEIAPTLSSTCPAFSLFYPPSFSEVLVALGMLYNKECALNALKQVS